MSNVQVAGIVKKMTVTTMVAKHVLLEKWKELAVIESLKILVILIVQLDITVPLEQRRRLYNARKVIIVQRVANLVPIGNAMRDIIARKSLFGEMTKRSNVQRVTIVPKGLGDPKAKVSEMQA